MKAKKVLNLFESEKTNKEIFDLIHFYFHKKLNLMGADYRGLDGGYIFLAHGRGYDYYKKLSVKYLRTVSENLGKYCLSVDKTEILLGLPDALGEWKNRSIFVLFPTIDSTRLIVKLNIYYTLNFWNARDENSIFGLTQFSSESELQKIYSLIDAVVKVVRLTPFESKK